MKYLKDFGKTIAHLLLIVVLLACLGNILISHDAKATAQAGTWLNAAQIESLRLILNTFATSAALIISTQPRKLFAFVMSHHGRMAAAVLQL
jgi:hypothetical protein